MELLLLFKEAVQEDRRRGAAPSKSPKGFSSGGARYRKNMFAHAIILVVIRLLILCRLRLLKRAHVCGGQQTKLAREYFTMFGILSSCLPGVQLLREHDTFNLLTPLASDPTHDYFCRCDLVVKKKFLCFAKFAAAFSGFCSCQKSGWWLSTWTFLLLAETTTPRGLQLPLTPPLLLPPSLSRSEATH